MDAVAAIKATNGGGLFSFFSGGSTKKTKKDASEAMMMMRQQQQQEDESEDKSKKMKSHHGYHHHHTMESSDEDEDVSGKSEDGDSDDTTDEDMEERRNLVQLSTESELNEIFNKLTGFKLKKIMAEDITDPSVGWTNANRNKTDIGKVLNPLDTELEMNIKALFNTEKFDIDTIRNTLLAYVNTPDKHTSTKSQRQSSIAGAKRRSTQFKKTILLFYPHLLNAMKALMVYTEQNAKSKGMEKEDVYEKHAYRAWEEVYSYLKSIQSIISYAMRKESITLDDFPDNFSVIIAQREKDLKLLKDVMISQKEKIQHLDRLMLERDKKIAEINAEYNGIDNHKMNLNAELSAIQSQIKSIDDPILIARQNREIIEHFTS